MKPSKPWDNANAARWVRESEAMRQMCRLIEGTLRLEPDKRPHEIRAAACMVILLGRENLWSTTLTDDDEVREELTRLVGLAARRLNAVKHLFEKNIKSNPELKNDASHKRFMESLSQEIRILEVRNSDMPAKIPELPPITWGEFW